MLSLTFNVRLTKMGIKSYMKLREFVLKNDDFTFQDCISLCSNTATSNANTISNKFRHNKTFKQSEVFEEGTWLGKDFDLAQEWAHRIRMCKPYFEGYNKTIFVGTMIGLFKNELFDFSEFMHKVRIQPKALVDCANREQMRALIEDILMSEYVAVYTNSNWVSAVPNRGSIEYQKNVNTKLINYTMSFDFSHHRFDIVECRYSSGFGR